jgi:imidazolonepropionase-like amidohydrolase
MSYRLIPALVFVLHMLPLQAQTDASTTTPDIVLVNGHVFTGSTAHPYVEAISIRGNRILAIGANKAILLTAGKSTRRIDLGGRLVIPGINDSHVHFEAGGDWHQARFWRRPRSVLFTGSRHDSKSRCSLAE